MASIEERLDIMEAKIKEPKFRDTTGKANEVNYWVFDYAPENELIVRDRIKIPEGLMDLSWWYMICMI